MAIPPKGVFETADDPANWHRSNIGSGQGWKYILTTEEVDDLVSMASAVATKIGDDLNALLLLKNRHGLGPACAR